MCETPRLVGHPKDLKRYQRGFVKTYWKRSCFVVLVKAVCCVFLVACETVQGDPVLAGRGRTFPVA